MSNSHWSSNWFRNREDVLNWRQQVRVYSNRALYYCRLKMLGSEMSWSVKISVAWYGSCAKRLTWCSLLIMCCTRAHNKPRRRRGRRSHRTNYLKLKPFGLNKCKLRLQKAELQCSKVPSLDYLKMSMGVSVAGEDCPMQVFQIQLYTQYCWWRSIT